MNGFVAEEDLPALGTIKAIDAVEQAGLSCPVRSDNCENLMGAHMETYSPQGLKPAKAEPDILHFQDFFQCRQLLKFRKHTDRSVFMTLTGHCLRCQVFFSFSAYNYDKLAIIPKKSFLRAYQRGLALFHLGACIYDYNFSPIFWRQHLLLTLQPISALALSAY